jgi:hypothetical protein
MLNIAPDQNIEPVRRLKQNAMKSNIIDLILRNPLPIKEQNIRKAMKENYNVRGQGSINIHLHSLKELNCIELISPVKGITRSNSWDIKTIKNLESIRIIFPDIPLNRYEKVLKIVSKGRLLIANNPRLKVFNAELILSISFFDTCVKNDIDTLYDKAIEMYKFGECFESDKSNESLINEVYTEFKKRVLIGSDFPLKYEFRHMVDETMFPSKGIWDEINGRKLLKEVTLKIAGYIFPDKPKELSYNHADELFKKVACEAPEEFYIKLVKIKNYQRDMLSRAPFIIFKHCFNMDILNDIASPEEKDFMCRKRELPGNYDESYTENICKEVEDFEDEETAKAFSTKENLYDEIIEKYMIPCIEK